MNDDTAIFVRQWHDTPITAGSYSTHGECAGCLHMPAPTCAGCGAAPVVASFPAGQTRNGAQHAMTFCVACLAVVLASRVEAAAEKARTARKECSA